MRLSTLFFYLIGSRQAILDIAYSRHSLWIGALFVLSAGFAREYDQEDLLHDPWYLLIPFGASLLTSFLLFLLARGEARERNGWPPFWSAYRSFLGLYWMTAPLAWLYAIPYERFLEPKAALFANLWTLALVAVWRVFLMIRVLQELMGIPGSRSAGIVILFGTVVAFCLLCCTPVPLVAIMSGTGLTDTEQTMGALSYNLLCLCVPVGMLGLALAAGKRSICGWYPDPLPAQRNHGCRGSGWLAVLSVAVWVLILPYTQPKQMRRHEVEKLLKANQITEALDLMSAQGREAFPPHWNPPPRGFTLRFTHFKPSIWDILEAISERPVAPWVRAAYVAKLKVLGVWVIFNDTSIYRDEGRHRRRVIRIFVRLPEAQALLEEWTKRRGDDQELRDFRRQMDDAALRAKVGLD